MTDREIAETIHATEKGKGAFRLIVQGELFGDNYSYHCLATNMTQESFSDFMAQRLLTMPEDWQNNIKTIRWLLVEMAGINNKELTEKQENEETRG